MSVFALNLKFDLEDYDQTIVSLNQK